MRVVADEVAAADLDRVHADRLRGEVDEPFRHRAGDRVADGPVLAHHVLVLEHDAGAGAVVAAGVGPADEVDDLVRLDGARARIHRVRADAGEVVDLEGADAPVLHHRDAALHDMVAGVDVGDEALQAVGDVLHRTAQELRERRRRHLVGIDVHLDAEGAADVLAHHPHLRLGEAEVLGDDVLHHVRRLGALVDGQAGLAGVPVGDHGARLERHAGVAAEAEARLDDGIGIGEGAVDLAGVKVALEGEVVAKLRVDDGRAGVERRRHVGHGLELRVGDLDLLGRVLGGSTRARNDGRDRLALPAGAVERDRVLRRRLQALEMRQHADPGRAHLRELGAGHDGDDARRGFRRARIDAEDAGMGMGRAHEGDVAHARQHHVADVLPPPLHEAREVRARHRAADIAVRPVEHGEAGLRVVAHGFASRRRFAAVSTASTIAW